MVKKILSLIVALLLFPVIAYTGLQGQISGQIDGRMSGQMAGGVAGGVNFITDANCMGAWKMTANGGNETDLSGEGGTLVETDGTIPTSTDMPTGYSGTSRDFEIGDTEYLAHADSLSTDISGANQPISIVCWIKAETVTGVNQSVVAKYNISGDQRQYRVLIRGSTDEIRFVLSSDGDVTGTCIGATAIVPGTWFHVACVYNDTDSRIYIDGVLDSNGVDNPKTYSDGLHDGTPKFSIGVSFSSGSQSGNYDGLITEVAIFDRELTAAEVLAIFNDGIDGTQ